MGLDPVRLVAVRAGMDSPAAKIRHASKHLDLLQKQVRRWLDREPYGFTEDYSDSEWLVARLKVRKKPPESFGLLAGDMAHDLRSALDHTVYQLARLTTDQPEGTQFPIFLSRREYLRKRRGKSYRDVYLAGVPASYRGWIDRLQPYHRPDPTGGRLAILSAFSNIDKHRLINAMYVSKASEVRVRAGGFLTHGFEVKYPATRRVDDGAELFRFRPVGAVEPDVDVDQLMIWTETKLDIGLGPGAITLRDLTDVWAWVFSIVGTLIAFVQGPTGLPFPIERPELKTRDRPFDEEDLTP